MLRDCPELEKPYVLLICRSPVLEQRTEKKKNTRGEDQEDRPNLLGKYHKEIMRSQEKQSSDVGN